MRQYELALIIRPEVDEEGQQAILERLSQLVTEHGGQVENVETWGRRRLAYPIRKVEEGFYHFVQGQFPAAVLDELDRVITLDESILRHMIVRKDE